MDSVWGSVLYCNTFSVLPMLLISYGSNDQAVIGLAVETLPLQGWCVLLFSCVVGTLIGYTGWLCRSMVSATSFTLVGVVSKFLTVLLNVAVWDKHSTPTGVVAVCLCLLAGAFYQQAPRRSQKSHEVEGGEGGGLEGGSVKAMLVAPHNPHNPLANAGSKHPVASLEIEKEDESTQPLMVGK
ncbi:hypothetical protein B484DRAFT_450568 [Ochromonadaceae sp. CCMP2298]|nr:hypothetical protein B484DRAFT_450568 [Ochromonadaceae sp. CCMP2298]